MKKNHRLYLSEEEIDLIKDGLISLLQGGYYKEDEVEMISGVVYRLGRIKSFKGIEGRRT